MLQARRSRTRETPEEQSNASATEDVGIIPMGIPMLAGPGSISTVMVLVGQASSWYGAIPVLVGIAITSGVTYAVLVGADRVEAVLGELGIHVVTRLDGAHADCHCLPVLRQRSGRYAGDCSGRPTVSTHFGDDS